MPDPSSLALPHVATLHAYTPGIQPTEPGWVKLNTNECPYPPSPRVAEAIRRELGEDGASLRLYPNPKSMPLRATVAALHGLETANVCTLSRVGCCQLRDPRCRMNGAAVSGCTPPGHMRWIISGSLISP